MSMRVDWTPEMIGEFWTEMAKLGLVERFSFAKGASRFLVPILKEHAEEGARCLDYGGGGGHLAETLLDHGFRAAIYEPGTGFEPFIEQRLGARDEFEGLVRAEDEASFDCVLCLEVVEHVHATLLPDFFNRLNRMTRMDGVLLMTCPNEEDLEVNHCLCPNCGAFFHRWQHLRRMTTELLLNWVSRAGFEKVWLGLIGFEVGEALLQHLDAQEERCKHAAQGGAEGQGADQTADPVNLRLGSESQIVLVARKRLNLKDDWQ